MSDLSANLALPLLQPAQAQKHVTHNEALALLDLLVQLTVERFDAQTPPALPQEGEIHALGPAPTGAWAGQGGMLAAWTGGVWRFIAPREGWRAYGRSAGELRILHGGAWTGVVPDRLEGLAWVGINTGADSTNRLSVAAEATLLNHAGADHRLKINKAGAGDTASLLFQTGFSGRAEMGLAGGEDFAIKVSDGSDWFEALRIDRVSGRVTFPVGTAGTGSAAGALGGQAVAFTGGRGGAPLAPGDRLAHGGGADGDTGPVMPFAGRIVAGAVAAGAGAAGVTTLAILRNGTPTGQTLDIAYPGAGLASAVADWRASPLAVAAGDAINWQVMATPGLGSPVTATFYVIFD